MSSDRQPNPFRFDLFISYASADNSPMQGSGPWVSQLVTRLKSTLEMRMETMPRVWFDWSPHRATRAEAQHAIESSALFLPILSPAYCQSDRCMKELGAFVGHAGKERVLKVVKAAGNKTLPLIGFPSYNFFEVTAHGDEELVDRPYHTVLNYLASQIQFMLTSLAKSAPAEAPRQAEMEVFLCHSSGDKEAVRKLWASLKRNGFAPWLDEKELLPGQRWEVEIQNAINRAGAIVVCLSTGSINKEGYLQREIRQVLDKALEMPEDVIFLIPARLEECSVPRRLSDLQWVNLYEDSGYERLIQALGTRAAALARPAKSGSGS